MTTLIMHIGWHQTASTAIQHALLDSRAQLLKQGVLYPLTGLYGCAHHSIGWSITGLPIRGWGESTNFHELVDELKEEIRSTACEVVIISSESLRLIVNQQADEKSRERLIHLFALFAQVKVICCVRHQAPQFESAYRFLVGWEHGHLKNSFHDFVTGQLLLPDFDYSRTEQFFCDLCSDISFRFWSFSEAVASGNVINFFFGVAGIEMRSSVQPRVNEALSREATLAILEWNRAGTQQQPKRKVFVDWATTTFPETGTSLYDHELLTIVCERFRETNSLLEERTGIQFLDTPLFPTSSIRYSGQLLHPEQLAIVNGKLTARQSHFTSDNTDQPRHHVVITGTGRAGTTFLVELLFHLGLNTGYEADSIEQYKYPNARAGLEVDIRELPCPYIVKSPWFCTYADEVLNRKDIIIDHVFIPIRDLFAAAESRRFVLGTHVSGKSLASFIKRLVLSRRNDLPGGLFGTNSAKPGDQETVLLKNLYKLILALSGTDVPVTLLRYPQMTRDSNYLFRKLAPVLSGVEYEKFQDVFCRVVRPELMHQFGDNDF